MKILVTGFVLTTLVATPAFAAKKHNTISPQAAVAQASVPFDQAYAVADGYTVIAYGQVVGRDPDPNIRFQLMRDPGLLAD